MVRRFAGCCSWEFGRLLRGTIVTVSETSAIFGKSRPGEYSHLESGIWFLRVLTTAPLVNMVDTLQFLRALRSVIISVLTKDIYTYSALRILLRQ